jgi:hypothetical protein
MLINIFSSDRRLYIQNYVNAHTFCDLHQYLYKHITTNSHHRLLNFAVCDTAIFSFDDNNVKRNGRSLQYVCTTSNHKISTVEPAQQHKYQSLPLEMTLSYSHHSTVV